ncbi:GNAT family N-acetyltransferase [Streptomyces erythrochromogenes]|uniref:GNAT family N-acetyltransferase n=1 Tax=Streptomyces erythrochromogenes TaxID=285574 RepID=UPI0033F4C1C5
MTAPTGPTAAPAVTVARALDEARTEQWDDLLGPRGFYAASPWLRHAQATADPAPYYFTASQDGRPVGVLPGYPLHPGTPYVFCSPSRVVDTVHHETTGQGAPWAAELLPALACGGRNPSHTKAGLAGDLGPDAQREVLAALVEAAEEEARQAGLEAVSFLYVDEDDAPLRTVLQGRGYAALPGQTAYSLAVPEQGGFDAYLARFDRRHRGKLNRELRSLDEAGLSYRTQPLTEQLIEELAPLELALYAKYGTPADATAFKAVLRSVAANTASAARVTTAHVEGRLAGFALTFTHRGELYARQAGFDYAVQGKIPLYFGLVYYELLRLALREGISHIHYSTGSDRAKLSRGCTPRRQIAYVKARRPGLQDRLARLAERAADQAGATRPAGHRTEE